MRIMQEPGKLIYCAILSPPHLLPFKTNETPKLLKQLDFPVRVPCHLS